MGCESGCAGIVDFTVCKGATFVRAAMWQQPPFIYKAITGVPQRAPLRLTVVGHGVVDNQLVAISDVGGMTEVNIEEEPPTLSEFVVATVIGVDTIEINTVNAAGFSAYTSGGYIRYYTLPDLAGFTGRMDIRDEPGGELLYSLSTTDGNLVIDNVAKTITFTIPADDSTDFDFDRGVYTLEIESAAGEVYAILTGKMRFEDEITTTETP